MTSSGHLGDGIKYGDEAVGNLLEVLNVPEKAMAHLLQLLGLGW